MLITKQWRHAARQLGLWLSMRLDPERAERATFLLGAAAAVVLLTLSGCYLTWLGSGCLIFLPFLSDLGIHGNMKRLWKWGLRTEGVLLIAWLRDVAICRHRLLTNLPSYKWSVAMNILLTLVGAAVVGGTFFIGSYPWDVYIVEHFLCADAIFYGGCAWGCGNVVISWTLRHTAAIESWDPCPWLRSWQLPMSIFTCVDLFGIAVLYSAAYDMDGRNGFFVWEWWLGVQQLAREDFAAYCEGRGWHEKGFINGMAVLEWVLLGCCFLAMVLSMPDVYLYQSWKQGCFPPKDSPAPRLAMEKWPVFSLPVSRMLVCISSGVLMVVLLLSYSAWLSRGCTVAVPMFSDLALALPWLFSGGVAVLASLWTCMLLNVTKVRLRLLYKAVPEYNEFMYILFSCGVAGAFTMTFSLFVVGMLPWYKFFFLHTVFLCMAIAGGLAWSCLCGLLTWLFVCQYSHELVGLRWSILVGILTNFGCFACGACWLFFFWAYEANPQFFRWGWWHDVSMAVSTNFDGYCQGDGFHSQLWIPSLVASEWVVLGSIFGSIILCQEEVELFHARCCSSSVSRRLPHFILGRQTDEDSADSEHGPQWG